MAPYQPKVTAVQAEQRILVCVKCSEPLDPADCCSPNCDQDQIRREKRRTDLLEWHVYRFEKAEPWYIEPPKLPVPPPKPAAPPTSGPPSSIPRRPAPPQ